MYEHRHNYANLGIHDQWFPKILGKKDTLSSLRVFLKLAYLPAVFVHI